MEVLCRSTATTTRHVILDFNISRHLLHCLLFIWCAGIRKTYWITCNNDSEMQNVMVERDSFPSHLVIKPKDLGRLLGHFQSSLQEITLIATEPVSTDMDPDSEAKAIELKSYIDPARGKVAYFTSYLTSSHAGLAEWHIQICVAKFSCRIMHVESSPKSFSHVCIQPFCESADTTDGALHTQLWIDPSEELSAYTHKGPPVDVTFSVKELKVYLIAFKSDQD